MQKRKMKTKNISDEYVQTWLKNHELKKDFPRIEFIEPYLKKSIESLFDDSSILDVGCGWESVIPYLKENQKYIGVDIRLDFFKYITNKFQNKNLRLLEGSLPNNLPIFENDFDKVICSMVLHHVENLKDSLEILCSKVNPSGSLDIITFRDTAKDLLLDAFIDYKSFDENKVQGDLVLPSGLVLKNEIMNFHKESNIEKYIGCYNFDKKYLGDLFVAYEVKN